MKIAYYPGCSATGSSADYEKSTQAVCAALGMQMEEIPGWSCCGSRLPMPWTPSFPAL